MCTICLSCKAGLIINTTKFLDYVDTSVACLGGVVWLPMGWRPLQRRLRSQSTKWCLQTPGNRAIRGFLPCPLPQPDIFIVPRCASSSKTASIMIRWILILLAVSNLYAFFLEEYLNDIELTFYSSSQPALASDPSCRLFQLNSAGGL